MMELVRLFNIIHLLMFTGFVGLSYMLLWEVVYRLW